MGLNQSREFFLGMVEKKSKTQSKSHTSNSSAPAEMGDSLELIRFLREHLVRFSAIANTGGVVAVISVLGATSHDGEVLNILAIPLSLFCLGIISALLNVVNAMAMEVHEKKVMDLNKRSDPIKKKGESSIRRIGKTSLFNLFRFSYTSGAYLLVGMVTFFILGCVSGVALIALA